MIQKGTNYIYYIFVLREYLLQLVGINHPREVVVLIILSMYKPIQISCGAFHNILFYDKIYVWGLNDDAQLGFGHKRKVLSPTELVLPENIKSISCGWSHTIALTYVPNKIYVWGNNYSGQLGFPEKNYIALPRQLLLPTAIKSVSCGASCTIALTSIPNKMYVWGSNMYGELGLAVRAELPAGRFADPGHYIDQNSPQELILCGSIISVSCGDYHTVALVKNSDHSNKIFVWGQNKYGQLGLGDRKNRCVPCELNLSQTIVSVSCADHTIALTNSNEIYVWGRNHYGQLGLGDKNNMHVPTKLYMNEPIGSVSCGERHTVALTKSGKCYVWGLHKNEKMYSGKRNRKYSPKQIKFREPIVSVGCGWGHTIVVTQSKKIYVWGSGECGQLGLGNTDSKFSIRELKF